jgi:SAM-dependent methyltransferase
LSKKTSQLSNIPSEVLCPVCGSNKSKVFFERFNAPAVSNLLLTSQDAARNCAKGDIKLAFCPVCSYIWNTAFDPNLVDYEQPYEDALDYSPRFQAYMRPLVRKLIERYRLHEKDILSVGCGSGIFLSLLCELGNNRGIGFEPSFIEQGEHGKRSVQVRFIRDFYSQRYSNYHSDLVVCRQTLEHIYNPKDFLSMIRRSIGNRMNTGLFFEVPNALNIFHKLFVWDIIYEHYSYFTPISLSRIFSLSGFRVCDVEECFENQFLCLHALPSKCPAPGFDRQQRSQVNRIKRSLILFVANYKRVVKFWKRKLKHMQGEGQRVVIWGAGSKGVSFLNTFKNYHIEYAVDINPRKQGKYVAGTGQKIVSPDFLREYQPDVIIIMNPIYKKEILRFMKRLGLSAHSVHSLHSLI